MLSLSARLCAVMLVVFAPLALYGQSAAPVSGEITVRLTEGLDSTADPKGMTHGQVLSSTNPAVPKGAAVLVGLGSDPINGGYTAKMLQITIGAQTLPAASSSVVLAPDTFGKLNEFARAKGQPKDAASGVRVFLPTKTVIKFTLMEPPPVAQRPMEPQPGAVARRDTNLVPPVPLLPFIKWDSPAASPISSDLKAACIAKDGGSQAYCYGIITTLYDNELSGEDGETYQRPYCMPSDVTASKLRAAFLAETEKQPDQLSGPVGIFYGIAMEHAFPCPKAPAKPKRTATPAKKKP